MPSHDKSLKFRSLTLLQFHLSEKLCTPMRGPLKIDPIKSKILELLKVYKSAFRHRLQINYKHRLEINRQNPWP